MWPVLATINGINVTVFGLSLAVIFVGASFAIWRSAKADYPDDRTLSLTLVLLVLGIASIYVWRWLSLVGALVPGIIVLGLWSKRFKWDAWEWFDILGPVSLYVGIFSSLAWGPDMLIGAGILAVGVVIVTFLKKYYRQFRWYTSGKLGFVGVSSLMVWCLAWLVVANWQPTAIYWGGLSIEQWVAIWTLIGCIITLYLRGDRKVTQDWKNITKKWQQKTQKAAKKG